MLGMDKAYLAGLVDGKGHFSFLIVKKPLGTTRRAAHFSFSMSVRADDRPLLEWVKGALGVGRISETKRTPKAQERAAFYVSRRADCVRVGELLDPSLLRSKKRHELSVWRDALLVAGAILPGNAKAVTAHNDKVFGELRGLADRLLRVRSFPLTSLP